MLAAILSLQCCHVVIFACSKCYAQKPMSENSTQNWLQNCGPDLLPKKCSPKLNHLGYQVWGNVGSLPRPTSSPNIQTASFQCWGIQCYVEIGIVREEAASHYMYDPLCRSLPGLSPGTIVRSSYCGAVLTAHLSAHCITLHVLPTRWSLF